MHMDPHTHMYARVFEKHCFYAWASARRETLGKKMDASDAYRLLDKKADLAAVSEALSHKANDDTVSALLSKVDDALDLSSKFDALQRDVAHKLGAEKDFYAKLDGLARIEDVNKALLEVRRPGAHDICATRSRSSGLATLGLPCPSYAHYVE